MTTTLQNGDTVRTASEWKRQARSDGLNGQKAGQRLAREFAHDNGASAIRWSDGHITVYVRESDGDTDDVKKIKIPAPAA